MVRKNIKTSAEVSKIINLYYKDKAALMEWVDKDLEPYATKSKSEIENLMRSATGLAVFEEK